MYLHVGIMMDAHTHTHTHTSLSKLITRRGAKKKRMCESNGIQFAIFHGSCVT